MIHRNLTSRIFTRTSELLSSTIGLFIHPFSYPILFTDMFHRIISPQNMNPMLPDRRHFLYQTEFSALCLHGSSYILWAEMLRSSSTPSTSFIPPSPYHSIPFSTLSVVSEFMPDSFRDRYSHSVHLVHRIGIWVQNQPVHLIISWRPYQSSTVWLYHFLTQIFFLQKINLNLYIYLILSACIIMTKHIKIISIEMVI